MASLLMLTIVVITSVMVFSYSYGLLGSLLVAPTIPTEALSPENYFFSPTNNNVTLYLRNTGTSVVTLVSYYVKDVGGNQYSKISWAGPAISRNVVGIVNIPISSACAGCTTQGTPFTFQQGNAYTVILITSKNAQFPFSVVR